MPPTNSPPLLLPPPSSSNVTPPAGEPIAPEDGVANPLIATSPSGLQPEEEGAAKSPPSSTNNELFSFTAGVYFAMGRIFSNNVVSPERSLSQNIPAVLLSVLRDLGFVAAVLWLQARLARRSAGGQANAAVGEGGARADGQRLGATAERKY
ncbi:hypothetical protein R3P38DRAFT_3250515 [Favolaschia claudopus]|uniref:Uncharacterized protein n=1 Tax=Favolaschia claudopus TaxID=2862362 RepID=A0AAW0EIH6_9AGAR